MQTVILAGGYGTRLMEETSLRPKPMIEIGEMPLLWHIMKIYSEYGYNEFIICLGYKGYVIKDFFLNYIYRNSDVSIDTGSGSIKIIKNRNKENWKIHLIDTGLNTKTANRLLKISHLISSDNFFMTYGDGLSNINIKALRKFHEENNRIATVTTVVPPARFGTMKVKNNIVKEFKEKIDSHETLINGGFFVLNKKVFDYINKKGNVMWEQEPMRKLTNDRQLAGYLHDGFWHPVDTLRDKNYLEDLWSSKKSPWKIWK